MGAGRPGNTPVGGYFEFPSSLAASPGVSPSNGARLYTDGTSLLASVNGGAYAALAQGSTNPTTGTLETINYTSPTTLTGAITGLLVNLDTNVTPGANAETGISILIGANTAALAAGQAALAINSKATLAYLADWRFAITTGTVAIMRQRAATAPAGGLIGWDIDLTNTSGAIATSYTGVIIRIPGTTRANSAGEGAFVIANTATAARSIDSAVRNTSGTLWTIYYDTATTIAAAGITGFLMNLSGAVTPGANAVTGLDIRIPATTRASTDNEGAIVVISSATAARALDLNIANTSGAPVQVRYGASTTIAGALTMLTIDAGTNVVPAGQTVTGIQLTIPSNTSASNASTGATFKRSGTLVTSSTWTGNLLNLQNTPTGGGVGVTLTENGVLLNVNHAPIAGAVAITDTTTAIRATLTPSTANSTGLRALDLLLGGNVTGSTAIANVSFNAASTLSGSLTMLRIDATTNVTPGANEVTGLSISIPATTRANTAGEGAIVVTSRATAARVLDLNIGNTSGAPAQLRYGSAATLAGALTAVTIDLSTNVTGGNQTVTGLSMVLPAGAGSSSACMTLDFRGTAGTAGVVAIANIQVGAATILTGRLQGLLIDLDTNVTAGAQLIRGLQIYGAATTFADVVGGGLLFISSKNTACRVLEVAAGNTSASSGIFILRYAIATTPTGVIIGANIDLSTNVGTNTLANIGIDVTMLAADRGTSAPIRLNGMRIFVNTGAPVDANGTNGDIYIRSDGLATTVAAIQSVLFHRELAVWKAIA